MDIEIILYIEVHDLRHTYASLILEQGQPLIYIQRQLGHHSIQITADIYSHLIPTTDRKAVNALYDWGAHIELYHTI